MRWQLKSRDAISPELTSLWEKIGISPVLGQLLANRGLTQEDELKIFLSPSLRYLPPLEVWPELIEVARYLKEQIQKQKTIAVWGDYDVDGITATALLVDFFERKNISVLSYLPCREQGYGLNEQGLAQLQSQGVQIVITVDCGISQVKEVEFANQLGLEVIITDHHLPGMTLPPAKFILNPKLRKRPEYKELAGVGVSFLLAAALNRVLPGPKLDLRQFLDLVALGTIADVVELSLENRILVKNGMLLLTESKRPGIVALKEKAGIGNKKITSGDIGFILGPRINACGRLHSPKPALELLLSKDLIQGRELAAKLDGFNLERKNIEDSILEGSLEQAQKLKDLAGLVLFNPEWHEGVIGIIASRVVQKFYRPCIVLTEIDGKLKGSGRSIPEVNLYAVLEKNAHLLEGFGGHKMAAGVYLKKENFLSFQQNFAQVIQQDFGQAFTPTLYLDAEVNFNALVPKFCQELELLQPFGPGNPRPMFLSPFLTVQEQRVFGNGQKHLSLLLRDNHSQLTLKANLWRRGQDYKDKILPKQKIRIAYWPKLTYYQGVCSVSLQVEEILSVKS